jgi:hypothetical protein
MEAVVDLTNPKGQWISVELPKAGSSCWVKGSRGELKPKIPHNSYPDKVFV